MIGRFFTVALIALALVAAPTSAAEPSLYPLPKETRGSGLTVGPDGAMWFSGHHGPEYEGGEGDYIGRVAGDWEVTEFPLPAGTYPGEPIDGPEGDLWFPSHDPGAKLGFGVTRMSTSGQMKEFRLSNLKGQVSEIVAAGNQLWASALHYRHHRFKNAVLDRYAVSPTGLSLKQQITFSRSCYPAALVSGTGGFWFAEECDRRHTYWWARLVHIGHGLETAHYRLPVKSFVQSLAIDPRGGVWYGSLGSQNLPVEFGRVAPAGKLARWRVPNGEASSITVGPEGRLWFGIFGRGRVNRMLDSIGPAGDPGTPICAGPGCGYTPYSLTTGADGELWYSVEHAHLPYGGGGEGAQIQSQEIAKEAGFLGHVAP
jgi:streptogramin lyase